MPATVTTCIVPTGQRRIDGRGSAAVILLTMVRGEQRATAEIAEVREIVKLRHLGPPHRLTWIVLKLLPRLIGIRTVGGLRALDGVNPLGR